MRALYWEQEPEEFRGIKALSLLKSDNPLVTVAFITGCDSSNNKPCLHLMSGKVDEKIIPRDKNLKRFNKVITKAQYESLDIPEAIEWINNLKSEE